MDEELLLLFICEALQLMIPAGLNLEKEIIHFNGEKRET